jgi:hypothetical protein
MAIKNVAWRENPYVPPGAEPGLTAARDFAENVQSMAVQAIARERFPYPNLQYPLLKTYVNRPEHTIGVRAPGGDLLFPDIVVLNSATTEVQMLGEVETHRSLYADDVVDKWKAFISVGKLYLFVPLSDLDWARKLIRQSGVKPTGLRTWRLNMGQGKVDIVDIPL